MSIMTARTIGTPRLDLLPLHVGHAEEMAAVLSDPALHTFIGGTPDTAQVLRSRYQRMTAGSPDPAVAWLNWVIRGDPATFRRQAVHASEGQQRNRAREPPGVSAACTSAKPRKAMCNYLIEYQSACRT
ncbi:hypothetical protein GCM10010358_80370 [Streptomyces minutiscleroticus]|uniref:Uncharacterized protein n=1 Tax=Streptomyces minutiscleroticus TaxID=68238 RepID=A0A918UAA7_9ACTN|nr:hypothetical protein GCM10010358_80370 [Streptomyces minutiscleroticus]